MLISDKIHDKPIEIRCKMNNQLIYNQKKKSQQKNLNSYREITDWTMNGEDIGAESRKSETWCKLNANNK